MQQTFSGLQAGCPPYIVPMTVADMEFQSPPVRQALVGAAEFGMWGYTYGGADFKQAIGGLNKRGLNPNK